MNVADRFRGLRELWGHSQIDMAVRVGVTRNTWQRYEKGELPNGETLQRLADQGVNVQWLLTGQGPMMMGAPAVQMEPRAEPDAAPARELDDELMARVVDTIVRAYKDAGVALAPMDLGRLAGMHYRRISRTNVSGVPLHWDETLAMLRFLRISIMDELQKGGAANDSKASDGR